MFIRLTNFHSGNHQYFNKDNIVTIGTGTQSGNPATYIETVNRRGNDEPYFVKETPKEIVDIIKFQEL